MRTLNLYKNLGLSATLKRALIKIISTFLGLLNFYEKRIVSNVRTTETITPPPVFIIGAPRTGSTLLYQLITNYFIVNYISNFSALFYKALYIGKSIEFRLLSNKPHNSFQSHHGRTKGLRSPNECGKFWYRWFPKNRDFVSEDEVMNSWIQDIRRTLSAITREANVPFIFKNLNCSQRIQALKKIVPEALFIFIRRDPLITAQSILAGKRVDIGENNTWWSVRPKNFNKLQKLAYPEQIAKQIFYIEKQIIQDLKLYDKDRHITVYYEDLCRYTQREMDRIEKFFSANNVKIHKTNITPLPDFDVDRKIFVTEEELSLLKDEVDKLNWREINYPNGENEKLDL